MSAPPDMRPPKVFPHCIVWTPIPVITWFMPFVGHMGICDSAGTIHDFAGARFQGCACHHLAHGCRKPTCIECF